MFSYKHLSNMSPFTIYLLSFLVCSTIALPTNTKNAEDPEIQYLPFYKGEVKYDDNLDWRVVGGSPATGPSQFPYMVSLRRASHFCGGSIISNNWILTAAHCTIGSAPTSISAVVGTATLNAGGDSYQISVIITHPDYSSSTISNDVSVIRTALNIAFGVNVQSIPIGTSYVDGGIQAILSGWGRTVTGGALPNQLQWLVVETVSVASCQQALSPNPVFESSLCTFTRAGQGACNGDSGGPLAVNGVVVALVSWGIPCARGYPDVFARVSSFSSWIIQNAVN